MISILNEIFFLLEQTPEVLVSLQFSVGGCVFNISWLRVIARHSADTPGCYRSQPGNSPAHNPCKMMNFSVFTVLFGTDQKHEI